MRKLFQSIAIGYVLLLFCACSGTKFIPDGMYMLDKVRVQSTDKAIKTVPLKGYIRQHPNARWFSLLKVPMGPYALSGLDSTKAINRFLQRIGEPPVVYDSLEAERTRLSMEAAVRNMGYLNAEVEIRTQVKGKKLTVDYLVDPGECYHIGKWEVDIQDKNLEELYVQDSLRSLLRSGMPFDVNQLEAERVRLTSLYLNNGYFLFNKDYISYEADSTVGEKKVDVKMIVQRYRNPQDSSWLDHKKYYIDKVRVYCDLPTADTTDAHLIERNSYNIYYKGKPKMRSGVLADRIVLEQGQMYQEKNVQATYNNLGRLYSVMSTNVHLVDQQRPDTNLLDCNVFINSNKPHSFGAELEGTNSAGNLGAALALSYQNRNLFRGSELFTLKGRGAFEAITGLEGYADQNYIEFSAEAGLMLPNLKFPIWRKSVLPYIESNSELSLMYNSQNRPEFHRRVLTGALRYRWRNSRNRMQHRMDLIDVNYIFMPWISQTFKEEYLDDEENRNAILRYNYENLFIIKQGYSFVYNSQGDAAPNSNYGKNATAWRFNIETAGNLLYGLCNALNTQQKNDQYSLFNIAFAQYVKGDIDFSRSFKFDERNSLAIHAALGVSYPYGNSTILPFEKRYFSGGANSVRGWSVRGLGPGTYSGTDGRIDFINQTGDIRLDLSAEYRTFLFWKLHGALFVDAGNIWTIREYEEQPGGQFHLNSFYKEIAVAYGLGLRLNFDFFILRLDGGMKAVNPVYETTREHFPIIRPDFKRDFTLHFAVGLPF